MFWQKTVVLLGLLAGLGSTSPSLVKRVNPADDGYDDEEVYYRADRRGHAEIKKDGGFKAWAHTNKLPPNLSLWDHCKVKHAKHGFGNLANDGYVGMTSDVQVTLDWVTNYIEDTSGTTTIYKIAQDRNLLACADVLEKQNPIAGESEFVAIGEVPWDQVIGWYDTFVVRGGTITDAKYTINTDHNENKYKDKPYGTNTEKGANPKDFLPLAGFPKGDPRWGKHPWNQVDPANCGSKKRSIFDDVRDEEMQLATRDNQDIELMDAQSEDIQLMPRARVRSKTAKKPSAKRPTRKAGKKTTKKTTKKTRTKKKTCSAAAKKANGGVCPVKCSAAAKKKNGGVCPVKCSAAAKKKNGGVCPATCSAAEKKQNGGVCPTCTAAEKKKNGGKCPPKSCPMPKTNQQLAMDYYNKYKAGTLGKKKSTTKTGGKKKGLF